MLTFYARGDSSSANNAEINSQNTNTTPVTELVFEPAPGAGGDTLLEYNGGTPDDDTLLYVDGDPTPHSFQVEFSGTLPETSKFANIGGLDLRGAEIVVITDLVTGQRYYFTTDPDLNSAAIMGAFPNGAIPIGNMDTTPEVEICFVAGTLIDTPEGPRAVEDLSEGDLVLTDQGPLPLIWVGSRSLDFARLMTRPDLWPISIAPKALGDEHPTATVRLSPEHRVVVEGRDVELAAGCARALVAAKFLLGQPGVRRDLPPEGVIYFHLLFATHRLVFAAGLASESLSHGPRAVEALGEKVSGDLRDRGLLPEVGAAVPPAPLPVLKRHEAALLSGQLA